jgi:hypothetical protein
VDVRRGGGDYTPLLATAVAPDASLDPRSLFAIGGPRLWAGQAPAILGYLGRVSLRSPSVALLRMLLLALWGEVSPRSLRQALRALVRLRDGVAGVGIRDGTAVEWQPRPMRLTSPAARHHPPGSPGPWTLPPPGHDPELAGEPGPPRPLP